MGEGFPGLPNPAYVVLRECLFWPGGDEHTNSACPEDSECILIGAVVPEIHRESPFSGRSQEPVDRAPLVPRTNRSGFYHALAPLNTNSIESF